MSFDKVKQLVLDYESNNISVEQAIEEINKVAVKPVDREWLMSYWNAIDIDEFVELLTLPELNNWKELTDEDSLKLINEALADISRNAVFQRNAEALERRYSKPEGTISGWVFHEDINEPTELLNLLKKDTTFYL